MCKHHKTPWNLVFRLQINNTSICGPQFLIPSGLSMCPHSGRSYQIFCSSGFFLLLPIACSYQDNHPKMESNRKWALHLCATSEATSMWMRKYDMGHWVWTGRKIFFLSISRVGFLWWLCKQCFKSTAHIFPVALRRRPRKISVSERSKSREGTPPTPQKIQTQNSPYNSADYWCSWLSPSSNHHKSRRKSELPGRANCIKK